LFLSLRSKLEAFTSAQGFQQQAQRPGIRDLFPYEFAPALDTLRKPGSLLGPTTKLPAAAKKAPAEAGAFDLPTA